MEQADDFLAESEALHALIEPLGEEELSRTTAFKGWTVNDVVRHLHVWNRAAEMSLRDEAAFDAFYAAVGTHIRGGLRAFETAWLEGLSGRALVSAWRDCFRATADRFGRADPSRRVKWAGPSMSARSSVTARLMETWAHGQEIYDELGVARQNADRIRNIVVLGNNTYSWTFAVRGEEAPSPRPYLVLTAPSGAIWTYNDPSEDERIEGSAEDFCQVVTQVRNVADTALAVVGANAAAWMRQAQCFAGPPETPPAPGTRRMRSQRRL